MSKKRDVFRLLERDCVNSETVEFIKTYINNILKDKSNIEGKSIRRKQVINKLGGK